MAFSKHLLARRRTRPLHLLLAAAALSSAGAPAASAATQTKDDAKGDAPFTYYGDRSDLRRVSWDVTDGQVTFDLSVSTEVKDGMGVLTSTFLDTDFDGRSNYAITGHARDTSAYEGGANAADFRLETTPNSTTTCQRTSGGMDSQWWGGEELTRAEDVPAVAGEDVFTYRFTFPASMVGGAQTFDWASYALGFDIFHNRFDYAPDAANYDASRPNPVTTVKDYCDTNGDGVHGDDDTDGEEGPDTGDREDSQSGSVPLVMAEGFTFPDAGTGTAGGGGGDGAAGGGGSGGWAHTTVDTTTSAAMPSVAKLRVDDARARILRAIAYADFSVREVNLAKPPKGVGFGDVLTQTPRAGTPLTAGVATLPAITLEVYAGPKPKGRADCLDRLAKDAKGMELALGLELLKQAGCRIVYDFTLAGADKEAIAKVQPRSADRVQVTAQLPRKATRQDLFINARENPNQLSFDAPRPADGYAGMNLLSSADQPNCLTIQVLDRAGRFVQGAQVRLDTSDVRAPKEPVVRPTDDKGETSVCALLPEPGRLDIVTWVQAANDMAIYGGHAFTVVDGDRFKTGSLWHTSSGRVLKKHKTGKWVVQAGARSARARALTAARTQDYGPLVNWLVDLFDGWSEVTQRLRDNQVGSGQKLNLVCAQSKAGCPAVLAVGDQPVGRGLPALVSVTKGDVVAAGGANVVAAGSANVVSAGGANATTGASSGVVAAGGGNVVSAGGANVVSAGGANVVSAGGANILTDGGAGLIGAAGANLIAINNAGLLSDNGLGR